MSSQHSETEAEVYHIFPIGHVCREDGKTTIQVLEPYIPALKQLEHFSHVQVCWWFGKFQDDMYRAVLENKPPYEAPVTGVFASRSPLRPNPIALTTARILKVDGESGAVQIADIDAFDGTAVIDLKPYIPVCDRVEDVAVPEWMAEWPEWMPEEGLGLEEGEEAIMAS